MSQNVLLRGATETAGRKLTACGFKVEYHHFSSGAQEGVFCCALGGLPLFASDQLHHDTASSGMYTCIRIYICICVCVCVYVYIILYICMCIFVYMYIHVYIHMFVLIYIHIYMYIFIYVCIHIYIYTRGRACCISTIFFLYM